MIAVAALYLFGLNQVGVLGPDEPRYAAIGQAMAQTSDYVTPKLWGKPWFEKPALIYWMAALGTKAGLNQDLAGRLPVALLSLLFLGVYFVLLRKEFGAAAAAIATGLAATCTSWLAFSSLCLTDLPLAAFFCFAVLLALPLTQPDERNAASLRWYLIGASLGFAALAKGLVPIALAAPLMWFLRHRWRHWWKTVIAFLVIATPWYAAVTAMNGRAFIDEFFVRHHMQRVYSEALQHVQPWYFYLLVFPIALFPWTPALFALTPIKLWSDLRTRQLLIVIIFGIVLFSIPVNKLPGYLVPFLPLTFALIGVSLANRMPTFSKGWLLACAVFISVIPFVGQAIPPVLLSGSNASWTAIHITPTFLFYSLVPVFVVVFARKSWAASLLVLSCIAATFYLKVVAFRALDSDVSARGLWREMQNRADQVCNPGVNRNFEYGVFFYNGGELPRCENNPALPFALRQEKHRRPTIVGRFKTSD